MINTINNYSFPNTTPKSVEPARLVATSLAAGYLASKHCLYKLTLDKAEIGSISQFAPQTSSLLKASRNAGLAAGIISTVLNGYEFAWGTIKGTEAIGNITADVASGVVGGAVGAGLGAMVTKTLGVNASKFAVGTLGMVVGTAGFLGVDILLKYTGVKDAISSSTRNFLDKLFKGAGLPQGS